MLTLESKIEFSNARRQAFIEEWFSFFTGNSNNLLSFEEVKESLRLQDSSYKGLQEIELNKIIGSTGRYRDFTRTFLPKSDFIEQRWRRLDEVAHSGIGFPPIEVYKVGEVYFVRDGNHRVSVMRAHGVQTIEAYVIEYKTSAPIDHQDNLSNILLKMEYTEFFETTHLDKLRPGQDVYFTEPGRYREVKEHIAFHKHLREIESDCEMAYQEAVASWYDNVYLPLVQLIREREILKYFPGRTEADLYTWLILHRAALEAEMDALGQISDERVVDDLKKEASGPLAQLVGFFHNRLNLDEMSLKAKRSQFLRETRLDEIRPAHNIEFTEPEGYELVKEHIAFHKYLREVECGCEMTYEEAVGSWFDNVYTPLIRLTYERDVSRYFLGRTQADLYVWLVLRRAALETEMDGLGRLPDEKIIGDLEQETPPNGLVRLAHFFGFKLKRRRTPVA